MGTGVVEGRLVAVRMYCIREEKIKRMCVCVCVLLTLAFKEMVIHFRENPVVLF